MVPTLRCGFVRSNFCFAMPLLPYLRLARDQLGGNRLRNFFVTVELHRELGATLRHRAQVGRVAEHLRERDDGLDHLRVADGLEVLDAAAPRVEVAHHVAEVVLGRDHLDGHDRLEQLRLRALHRFLEGHRAGDLEGDLARVDVVVRAVDELDAHVDDGIPGEHARLHRLLDAEVDRRDVLLGDFPADDLVHELVAVARRHGFRVDHSVAVLAATSGLADELALNLLDRLAERLAVRDLWAADVRVDVELALEAVDDDLEVQLAHAGDQRLAGLVVGVDAKGRILLAQPLQARAELVLVGLRLRLDRDRDDGIRERHRLELDRRRVDGERVARRRVLEADARGDLPRADLLALLAVIRVHLEDAADPLGLAGRRVEDAVAGLDLTGVDAEVRQLADVRVGHDLEGERRERLVDRRAA